MEFFLKFLLYVTFTLFIVFLIVLFFLAIWAVIIAGIALLVIIGFGVYYGAKKILESNQNNEPK